MFRVPVAVGIAAAALVATLAAVAAGAFEGRPPPPAEPPRPAATPTPVPRPGAADPALLFTELILKPGENGSRTLRLTRAAFHDGKLTGRDGLHTGDASEFGFGARYRVIDGRYVVLQSATVFDLAERKVRHSFAGGQVLAVEGTAVYFSSIRGDGPNAVFRYDVATGAAAEVAALGRWGLRGAVSPGGTKAMVRESKNVAVLEGNELPFGIALDRPGRPREPLGTFAATSGITGSGWVSEAPPGVWLDDDRFLTQTTLGQVVVLDTAAKKQDAVVDIPLTHKPGEKSWDTHGAIGFTPLGFQEPRFSRLPDGRVVYEADLVYLIDVAKKTWEKAAWLPLGHGFEYSAVPERGEDRTAVVSLRHKGRVIGTSETVWWTTPEKPRVMTTDGYLAVIERVLQPGKAVPADAIRVWSAATGTWQTLDAWADALVGWVR
jgi:hypothetical protein